MLTSGNRTGTYARVRDRRRRDHARRRARHQEAGRVVAARQAAAAPRRRREDQRQRRLRHRRAGARHGLRRGQGLPRAVGHAQELRRQRHQGPPRHPRRHRRSSAVPGKTDHADLQDCVAVVADSWWRAKTALDALPIEWDFGASANASTEARACRGAALARRARRSDHRRRGHPRRDRRRRRRSSPPTTTAPGKPTRAWSPSTRP